MTRKKTMFERRTNVKPVKERVWRTCLCAEQVDDLLRRQGARLTVAFSIDGSARAIVATHRNQPRAKLKALVANFCPFCGKKYVLVEKKPKVKPKAKAQTWMHTKKPGEPEKKAKPRKMCRYCWSANGHHAKWCDRPMQRSGT